MLLFYLGFIIDINHHVVILLQVLALVMTSFNKDSNIIWRNNSQFVKYNCSSRTNTYYIITDKHDSRRELVCGVTGIQNIHLKYNFWKFIIFETLLTSPHAVKMISMEKTTKSKDSVSRPQRIDKEIEEGTQQQNKRRQKVNLYFKTFSHFYCYLLHLLPSQPPPLPLGSIKQKNKSQNKKCI